MHRHFGDQTTFEIGLWACSPCSSAGLDTVMLDRMAAANVRSYCFSVAGGSVHRGTTRRAEVRSLGVADRLVDELLKRGIEPYVALDVGAFSSDLGWTSRSTIDGFVDFGGAVASRLGDRIDHWLTMSEIEATAKTASLGSVEQAHVARHHLLLAHGHAVRILRAHSPGAEIGLGVDLSGPVDRRSDTDPSAIHEILGPIHAKRYPDSLSEHLGAVVREGDLDIIGRPFDLLVVEWPGAAGEIDALVATADSLIRRFGPSLRTIISCRGSYRGMLFAADVAEQMKQAIESSDQVEGCFIRAGFDHTGSPHDRSEFLDLSRLDR